MQFRTHEQGGRLKQKKIMALPDTRGATKQISTNDEAQHNKAINNQAAGLP